MTLFKGLSEIDNQGKAKIVYYIRKENILYIYATN